MKMSAWLLLPVLSIAALPALAKTPTALPQVAPDALRDAALGVAQAVDGGQAAQLWQAASPVTRADIPQQLFLDALNKGRQGLGQPSQRQWVGIYMRDVSATQRELARPGRYGNVRFATTFANNRPMTELVSFRLDEDGQWRFTGYVIEPQR